MSILSQLKFNIESEDNKIIITAQTDGKIYLSESELHPGIIFNQLKQMFLSKNYTITLSTDNLLQINIAGFFIFQFKRQLNTGFQELSQTVKELKQKLEAETLKNKEKEQAYDSMRSSIQELKIKFLNQQFQNQRDTKRLLEQSIKIERELQYAKHQKYKYFNRESEYDENSVAEQSNQNFSSLNIQPSFETNGRRGQLQARILPITTKQPQNPVIFQKSPQKSPKVQKQQQKYQVGRNQPQKLQKKDQIAMPSNHRSVSKIARITAPTNPQIKKYRGKSSFPEASDEISDESQSQSQNSIEKSGSQNNMSGNKGSKHNQKPKPATSIELSINPFQKSKVISTNVESQNITNFLNPKTIKTARLLYRASQSEFSTTVFHQKCDGFANTLTVLQTQFLKKIGGFTHLPWNSSEYLYDTDESKQSFIFSLTKNDKFQLKNPNKAIFNSPQHGPWFGQNDIVINDKANLSRKSWTDVSSTYVNSNYKHKNKRSLKSFSGNYQNVAFRIKEWEVWQLEFN